MAYAEKTTVPVSQSRDEIERTLNRYGATSFAYATQDRRAIISFGIVNRRVRFLLELPDPDAGVYCTYMRGSRQHRREPDVAAKLWEQACRQKWRALALVIKAKLEAVDAGITTVEDEFLAHTVLPGGETVGERTAPIIAEAYRVGHVQSDFLQLGAPAS